MIDKLKEIVAYCAANIVDWFRSEIEDCVEEWCDDNEVSLEFDEDWDDLIEGDEGIIWEE